MAVAMVAAVVGVIVTVAVAGWAWRRDGEQIDVPWMVLTLGWALTASLTLYLVTVARRRLALESQVVLRTRDLRDQSRKLAKANARAERDRQRLRLVLDHAPLGIWLTEMDGRVRFVNAALRHTLGLTEEQFLAAAHYTDLLDEEVARQARASDAACLAQRLPYHSVETVVRSDGERREMEVVKVRIPDPSGETTGIVGIANDVTEKHRAQAQEQGLRRQMEHTQRLESLGVMEVDRAYLTATEAAPDLAAGRYCFFEVADTGCGMDTATVERIFDPFYTTKSTGRGLGMSAVAGIVRGHHGALKVYSEVGKGTNFKILLPVVGQPAIPLDHPDGSSGEATTGSGGVLVVEDEAVVRDVATRILSRAGFTVLTAKDGVAGVEMLNHHRQEIDVVLLDMTMPRMDGQETFQRMRAIDPQVRVVLTSGYSEQHATGRLVDEGIAGFIQKPYRVTDLIAVLCRALEGGGS